ncbi:MAG: U32 family peptidase [Clostridia bacterium]|nr:U32 family peptidase [Clostridia bacterium]
MCEILAPVGSKENLISAINAGADAVYLGLTDFSARKTADNFTLDELKYAVAYAKAFDVKVYVTVNTLIKNSEIDNLLSDINVAYSYGVDAFILQDLFLGDYLKKIMPEINLHLSTQAGVCNKYGAILAKKCGFSRVILARETKIEDIKEISQIIETEVFIQGALCTCLSGHCYFSSFVGGNSGNRGLCKQPCRKEYSIEDGSKTVKSGYLISLADLSVREDIEYLKNLGVKSFKIEGRLRSKEYVYSAVKYYKELLNGNNDKTLYNALKIAFNRGNYTKGLAFGQKYGFISDKIQNNMGLKVGKVKKIVNDELILDCNLPLVVGDSFKIIRNGLEVGNATTVLVKNQLKIKYMGKVLAGDDVHLTKKVDLYNLLCDSDRKKSISVSVYLKAGEPLKISSGEHFVESEFVVECAKSAPITKNDIETSLKKTDIYPYNATINFDYFDDNCFIVKSALNKLRARFYEELFYRKIFKKPYIIEKYAPKYKIENSLKMADALIVSDSNFEQECDNIIYFPNDYSNAKTPNGNNRVWLYVPPFASGRDLEIIDKIVDKYDGVYGDGVWVYEYALSKGLKLFAGVGFNVFNSLNVEYLMHSGIEYICASKELSFNEISKLNYPLFVLSGGAIEIMDLIYCPLGKNCKNCDIKADFTLVDTANRRFKVRRYKLSECRFKVYNNAKLINLSGAHKVVDLTIDLPSIETSGNLKKGIK